MTLFDKQSIAGKITRMTLIVCGVALLLAYVCFLLYDVFSLRRDLVANVRTEASIVGSNTVAALLFDDPLAAEKTLSALGGSPHVVSAVVLQPDGQIFARYDRNKSDAPLIQPRLAASERSGNWDQPRGRVLVGHEIQSDGKVIGSVYILAETTDIAHRARQFGFISAGILTLCFFLALLTTIAIREMISRPLTALAETARVVSRGKDYSVRASAPASSDELGLLIRSFNQMLEQIQDRDHALEDSRRGLEKRVEERTNELVQANRELEAFSYSVAHDLRGPLQHITNLGFVLQQSGELPRDGDGGQVLEKLMEATRRMSSLIDDLLNLSRATSTPLRCVPVDLTKIAESVFETLLSGKGDREVEITVAKGAHAIADEGLISIVVENLIRNAWKYSSKRQVAKIEFGFREEAKEVIFYVRDNGAGFNPNYADRLFRPFQRLHSLHEFPGTGVGLATVQRIIARHGGRVGAESVVNEGAMFFFTLPYGEHEDYPQMNPSISTGSKELAKE